MKKHIKLVAGALVAVLLAGCNKSGKLSTTSTYTPPSGPVELKLKWPKGERIVQDMDMKVQSEITMPGQPTSMKQDMDVGQQYSLTVLEELADGGHKLEMEFLSMRMDMTMAGKKMIDYDSTKKADASATNLVAGMLGNMVGAKLNFLLDGSNAVERVEGVDELMGRISAGGPAQALQPLKAMFSEDHFKQMMSYGHYIPPRAVQPGDTWTVQTEISMASLGTMVIDYNFTFKGWEMRGKRNCARMEFEGTIKSKPGTGANPTGMSMSVQDGTTSGVTWFDPEIGLTIETSMNQDMDLMMTLTMGGAPKNISTKTTEQMDFKLASVQ